MKLRDWRKRNRISVKRFAEQCDVSQASIRHYETGVRRPRVEIAQRIEAATKGAVSAKELLGLPDSLSVREESKAFDHGLASEAKALGLDPEAIAKKAVEDAVKRKRIDAWIADNRDAMETNAENVRQHGLWSDGVRLF